MRLAEARLERHAPGGSMPSQTLKHCKIESRRDAPKMAILEAPCAQNTPGRSTMRLPEALLSGILLNLKVFLVEFLENRRS